MRTPHGRLSAQDVAVLEALVPVGILVAPDESMKLVPVLGGGVVAAHVGASADSLTADHGLVFWFDPATHSLPINRMATFNLHAVSAFSLRTGPAAARDRTHHRYARRATRWADGRTDQGFTQRARTCVAGRLADAHPRRTR